MGTLKAALAALAAGTLVACGGGPGSGHAGKPSASSSPGAVVTGPGFTLEIPSGWLVSNESPGEWPIGSPPHKGAPGFVTVESPANDPWMVFGSRSAGSAASVADFLKEVRASRSITYRSDECMDVEDMKPGSLANDQALVL